MRATAVGVAGALVWTLTAGPASASPDWNLGNTGISQSYNLNAQASGPIANPGLGKCLDDPAGNTANGTAVASSACTGAVHQNWTFTPYADYTDEGSFHGTVTPVGAPGKCLDVTSTNGGAAKSVAVGGSVQMLMTTSGELYAKNSAGMGGWTKESDFELEQIAAGSDGTQMMVPGDGSVYARNTVGGASGWTSEGGVSAGAIATNGGVQLYLGRDGTVYARNGIGPAAGWVAESAPGATAISVGSDGTQMMMAADGTVYARNSIGAASGWVKEVAPGTKAIVTNGGVQILIGSDGYVYAKSGIGMGGWTPEGGIAVTNPTSSFPIAAGSDGTQLKLGTDGYLYAQKGIGLNRWTKEAGPLNTSNYAASIAAGAGGLQAFILDNGVVNAQTGIAASGSSAESDLSTATVDGSPAQLTDCGGWKSQQWLYQYNQNGGTQLYNPAAQRCLDTPGSSTADGEALQIYACNGTNSQRFIPPSGPAAPNGQIVNASMNKCAIPAATSATPADGTAVVLFGCGVGYTQPSACSSKCPPTGPLLPWTLQSDGSLTAAGLCLGIVGGEGATNDGTKVELAECQESLDQQWVVGYDTGGNPRLVNPNSGRCLDDPGSSVNWGTQLQIYTCNNTGAQVWGVPHAGHTFVGPATPTTSVIPPGTGDDDARRRGMQKAEAVRITLAHLGMLLHAGGTSVRTAAGQSLAGSDTGMGQLWGTWEDSNWVGDRNGPIAQDAATAATADQARTQRTEGISHFLDGYPMMNYGSRPDFNADVTSFMSKNSTYSLETQAAYNSLPITHADQAAKDRVTAIAAAHAAADPSNASSWTIYRDNAINGSADDVRRFIQYDGWPTVAPAPGTPEFRNEVESLKARWAGADPSNPIDPADVLLGVEETAWAEWQAELNAQAQPRADIVAAEMQSLDALKAGAETMHDGLDYAWTAGGILWAENQKTSGADPVRWSDVDISQAPYNLNLIKAKVAALAGAAQNEAVIAQDAANKAVAARSTAYATASAAGLPEGRGLTYALQSVQVALAAAAAAQATANAMQTALAATNATLADSATLLANASAQAHAARALYLRETAQDNAAQAQTLATQAKNQAAAAATAAGVVASDKAKVTTAEATAKDAQARADAAAADAANQATIAANAETTAEAKRADAAAKNADAQQQADIATAKEADASTAASSADSSYLAAQQAADRAAAARAKAVTAQRTKDAAEAKAQALAAVAAADQGTDAAAGATAAADQARADADAASAAADQANADATQATSDAATARAAATQASAASAKASTDSATADSAAEQTHSLALQADALAADAIKQAGIAASQSEAAQASAAQAQTDADNAKAAAAAAQNEAAGALSDSATATGQALATAQAAQATAAEAATVAAPADQAIDLAAPYAATDSAAGLASLSSEAAKTMAQQQADAASAEATQAAALAAAAQDAANRASGDAKLAAQAAADAATAAASAAASASAAAASAAQAGADAQATKQSDDRINAMDAKAQQDATNAHVSAQAASSSAAAAQAAATASETDAAAAHAAADTATAEANAAQSDATEAANAAAMANTAAASAQADATAAQQAAAAAQAQEAASEAANRVTYQHTPQTPLSAADQALLLAHCGQTCLDDYNQAQALAGTDLTTFLLDNGGQLLMDVIGVDDIENCFTKGDVVACIWTVVDFIPATKLAKLADFVAKVVEVAPKIAKFIGDLEKAKQLLERMGQLLEQLRKVRDQIEQAKAAEDARCANPLDDPNPSKTNGAGNISYWPMQPFGDGTRCRATGAEGVFDNTMTAAGKQAKRDPAGLDDTNPLAATRGHLIGKQFGGSANNPRNFVPMSRALNNDVMSELEDMIATKIKAQPAGSIVHYQVVPIYPDSSTPIPSQVEMTATGGGLDIDCTLTNAAVGVPPTGKCS